MKYPLFPLVILLLSSVLSGCVETTGTYARPERPVGNLYVLANVLNVRECPTTNCRKVSVLYRGDEVSVLNRSNGWYEVQAVGSRKRGWVSAEYLADYQPAIGKQRRDTADRSAPALPEEEFGSSAETESPPAIDEEFGTVTPADKPFAIEEEFGSAGKGTDPSQPPVIQEEFAR